jgi:hypothetical protein
MLPPDQEIRQEGLLEEDKVIWLKSTKAPHLLIGVYSPESL